MRFWLEIALGAAAALLGAAYAEFVLDIRGPLSSLESESAMAAITLTSYGDYWDKEKEARAKYGSGVIATADEAGGKWTVTADGSVFAQGRISVTLAGMYGLFAVTSGETIEGLFPFDIVPTRPDLSGAQNVKVLQERFENFPKRFLAFADDDVVVDSCQAPHPPVSGIGFFAKWLPIQSQAFCLAHWKGPHPASMLIGVTLANGDPWMRPFARRLCRAITTAALKNPAFAGNQTPAYAACVLVDRPDRRKPHNAQETFTSVVYEIDGGKLARMNAAQ
jgi:hypothetical protein